MDLITKFLTLHNQLKVYHWQTESYAQHQAFGSAYDEFTGYIDQFIEEFMGKNARIMAKGGFKVESVNISDKEPEKFIEEYKEGRYIPYSDEDMIKVLTEAKKYVQSPLRINRKCMHRS